MRLAGFNDSWTPTTLSAISSYRKIHRTSIKKYYVSTENILQNYQGIERFTTDEIVAGDGFNCDDILMGNIRPYLKKVCLADFDGVCNADVLVFKSESVNPRFLHCILANDNFINFVMSSVKGSKMPRGDKGHIMQYPLSIPRAEEQAKIANFIALLNERIHTQSKIIEDLLLLKQWIIHRCYSVDNNQQKQKFGSYITQISIRNSLESITNVLSVSNKNGFVKQNEQFEDREVASEDKHNYKIVERNDFAYNPARINVGSIARLKTFENGIVSPMYVCFRANDKVLPEYLDYYFQSMSFFAEMSKRLEGSVRQCLSYEALSEIKVFIPSLDEQKEIIKKLNSVENKIELEKQILLNYQYQKKYLLSQMFI